MTMDAFFEAVLNGWWQGIVLTFVVWLVMRDMPRISAATRLAIWHVTLVVVLLLPVLQRIPVPSWQRAVVLVAPQDRPAAAAPLKTGGQTMGAQPGDVSAVVTPAVGARPVIEFSEHHGGEVLLILAIDLAILQLLRLAFGYWAVRRLKRKAVLADHIAAPVALRRPVKVLISDRIGMPMAVGYRQPAILLPRAMAERLTPEQLRHVLLHESAHLLRNDDWIALTERIVRAIFFFQPAVYWIGRQIEREREIACDDWVIAQADEAKPYAASLARVAELGSRGRAPILATGAGKPKAIFARLETLLDRTRNRMPSASEPLVMLAGLCILLAVSQGAHFNRLLGFSNYSNHWVESDGTNRREFKMRGEIHFTPDDLDVESMSPGAKMVLEQADGWRTRTLEFEADERGDVQRRYYADGVERPFDSEARRLAAKFLPQWVREQGLDIPERLARLIGGKGADGALEEVRSIRSSGVKRQYLEEFFVQTTPTAWQMSRALKIASEFGSDYDKRRFLETVRDRYADRGLDAQVLGFIDGIQSDDDRRQLLAHAIERETFAAPPAQARMMRSIARLSSDDAKSGLLRKAVQASRSALPEAFFETAATIHSDDEREHVLTAVLASHTDDPGTAAEALRSAETMSSDECKARTLLAAARGVRGNQEAVRQAARVLASMHSDGDRRRAIEALIAADGENAATVRELLLQTMAMNSDGDKSSVLLKVAATFKEQEQLRRTFFSAVNTLHSSEDQRRVLMAVLQRPALETETLGEIARSASQISSNDDQAAVLKALAERR